MTPKLRRGRWTVDIHYRHPDGSTQRIQKVVPVQTEKAARMYEQQVLSALARGEYKSRRPEVPTVEGYSVTYLRHSEMHDKVSTRKSKRDALRKHLLPRLGKTRLDDIGSEDVLQLREHLKGLGLSPKTSNNVVGVLSGLLRQAHEDGVLEVLPGIKWLKVQRVEEPALTQEEFRRLADAADEDWRPMLWVGGWGSLSMVQTYVCLSGEDLKGSIALLGSAKELEAK